ncbi:acyl-CoA carboxylase subunit epsilon [Prauserella flavalba]|uniref:Acetyl-CoA carboxylase biotin carboxyl carrier protein subunit n=1 Tax=Prauserella flavalba TaxID=1477506 RepID=A0A318LXT7_9PSEU|nr:acyl-CoA carboxylase subunit epsilon [Prauserella flavalba]PXY37289.1 acetyl-CoA carboxylase biotin carboxyl carrier protein subunit [Prauserella flavalba]
MSTEETTEEPRRPLLRVVRGNPDDAEIAALTAVLAGLASASTEPPEQPARSRWADRAALVRAPLRPGQGAWRASALPR